MAEATKSQTPNKPAETKRETFVRLAERRVSEAVALFGRIEQLARPTNYEYTAEDVSKIEATLQSALDRCVDALKEGKPSKQSAFTL